MPTWPVAWRARADWASHRGDVRWDRIRNRRRRLGRRIPGRDYAHFRRAAHLRYVGMPGGELAVREPWRMAMAHLRDAGIDSVSLTQRLPRDAIRIVDRMLERQLNSPATSSADAVRRVASLIGLRDQVSFEGRALLSWNGSPRHHPMSWSTRMQSRGITTREQPRLLRCHRHASDDSRNCRRCRAWSGSSLNRPSLSQYGRGAYRRISAGAFGSRLESGRLC